MPVFSAAPARRLEKALDNRKSAAVVLMDCLRPLTACPIVS